MSEFMQRVRDFNRRARKAEQDGFTISCGKVYDKETYGRPGVFSYPICEVIEYPLGGLSLIKKVLATDVDGIRARNIYTIEAIYNRIHPDGYADVVTKQVARIPFSWYEIEEYGGVCKVVEKIKERYSIR